MKLNLNASYNLVKGEVSLIYLVKQNNTLEVYEVKLFHCFYNYILDTICNLFIINEKLFYGKSE